MLLHLQIPLLQSQDLRVDQEKERCIMFTQKNSIENSVQDCLPYILKLHGYFWPILNSHVFALRSTYIKHIV